MSKQKSLSQVWRHKRILLLATSLSTLLSLVSCGVREVGMTVPQYQKAMDLVDQGTLLMRAGRTDEAYGAFAAASEIGPMAAAIDGLGCVALFRGDFLAAEQLFVQAYEMDKNYYNSLSNLALLYEISGLKDKADQLYGMALESEPENFRLRNNFAVRLIDKEDRKGAKAELLKALALAKHPIVIGNVMRLEEND